MHNMSFKINFSYRIGKIKTDSSPRRKRKTVSNDDLKGGGGDDSQGGGDAAPAGGGARPAAPGKSGKPAAAPVDPSDSVAVDATGTWTYKLDSPQGGGGTFTLTKDGEIYTGTISSDRKPEPTPLTAIVVNGHQLSFAYPVAFGSNIGTAEVVGTIADNALQGTLSFGPQRTVPIRATRGEE